MQYYDFSNQQPILIRRKRKKIASFFLLGVVFIIVAVALVTFHQNPSSQQQTLSVRTAVPTLEPTVILKNTSGLQRVVQSALQEATGTYSVVIKNLKTNESYTYNEHVPFMSGSLYKLWVMAATFEQIRAGDLTEDQVLTDTVADLNERFDIASDSAELQEGTVTFTTMQALEQMITISHNYAALLLSEKIKVATIDHFLHLHGFNESRIGQPPQTTAYDIALFLEELYKGQLANKEDTQTMLTLLKRQKLNGKLPKYLPEDVSVAHKTGELDMVSHDAGIVYTDKGDYVIVVLTESTFPQGANERIAAISKGVYYYFEDK